MCKDELKSIILEILPKGKGEFITSYQICDKIEEDYPEGWEWLICEYPPCPGCPPYGVGCGRPYCMTTFVSNTLSSEPKIVKRYLDCKNLMFKGTKPSCSNGWIAIWALETRDRT